MGKRPPGQVNQDRVSPPPSLAQDLDPPLYGLFIFHIFVGFRVWVNVHETQITHTYSRWWSHSMFSQNGIFVIYEPHAQLVRWMVYLQ